VSKADRLRIVDYLRHILEAIERIDEYVGDMTELCFLDDRRTQDAVIRNFEVIGEACRNLVKNHAEFVDQNATVPWNFAWEMRNALAHGYFKIDFELVWKTIQTDLPILAQQVRELLAQESLK